MANMRHSPWVLGVLLFTLGFSFSPSVWAISSDHCTLRSFHPQHACTPTFQYGTAVCYSGKIIRMPEGCFTLNHIAAVFTQKCQRECDRRSEKCGFNSAYRGEACDSTYRGATGICSDGTTVSIRENTCLSEDTRRREVEKECAKKQCQL